MKEKSKIIQVKNPKTKKYVKIKIGSKGKILGSQDTPYEGIPIVKKKQKKKPNFKKLRKK